MGGRPPKPIKVIEMDKKWHIGKKDVAARKAAEEKLLSGSRMKESPEVKADPVAHKEFMRMRRLMAAIEKDDELYSNQINTYALLQSEITELLIEKEAQRQLLDHLRESMDDYEDDKKKYFDLVTKAQTRLDNLDTKIDQKRAHREKIDKENGFTVTAALRTIPKKPEQNQSELKKALYGS